jgi:hypothetical protein
VTYPIYYATDVYFGVIRRLPFPFIFPLFVGTSSLLILAIGSAGDLFSLVNAEVESQEQYQLTFVRSSLDGSVYLYYGVATFIRVRESYQEF